MEERRSRRQRAGGSILAMLLVASTLVFWQPPSALGQSAPAGDLWSGRWNVEGQSTEDGPFSRFGVLKLELDNSLLLPRCGDSDRHYSGTYKYGGGGTFEGCERSDLDYELFFRYYNTNGSWGQGGMTFKGGSPATWEGYYSPPTFGSAGEQATLRWRGSKIEGCAAPMSRHSRRAAQTEEESCSDPVIFVPGFLGSIIKCPGFGGEVWPDAPTPEFLNMRLDSKGTGNFEVGSKCNREATHGGVVFKAFRQDVYGKMRDFLTSLPGVKSYFYGYDWRKSPRYGETQEDLDKLVDRALKESGRDKVTLVAHSMGGLVARWYVGDHPNKVARVVTLGTPYWGAPKPWLALSRGLTGPPTDSWWPDLDSFIPDDELKEFAQNASGAYNLYPSASYFEARGGWLSTNFDEPYLDIEGTIRAVAFAGGGNSALYRKALAAHEARLDSYAGTSQLDWQMIVGTGLDTVGLITDQPPEEPSYVYTNGDGTVPEISAAQGMESEDIVHYVCDVEHAALPGNAGVQQMIKEFVLTGGAIPNPAPGGCDQP